MQISSFISNRSAWLILVFCFFFQQQRAQEIVAGTAGMQCTDVTPDSTLPVFLITSADKEYMFTIDIDHDAAMISN